MSTTTRMAFAGGLYHIQHDVSRAAIADQIHVRQAHLSALLTMTYGVAAEAFGELTDECRDSYMAACSSLSQEIGELTKRLAEMAQEA